MRKLSAPQIALVVAALTFGSKFIGFAREIIKANYYGTTYVVDSLSISESIPSMIFAGILAATATSFMPLFSEKIEREGETAANRYTSQVINILVVISIISSLVGILLSKQMVTLVTMPEVAAPAGSNALEQAGWFITHGWTGEKAELSIFYVRITFSYVLFSSVAGILESYIMYKGVFIRQVLAGYSISVLLMVTIIYSHIIDDPRIIVFGALAGQAIRLLVVIVISRRENYRYTPDFHMTETVKMIFSMAFPIFIGTSVGQISTFIDNMLASGLDTGNIASITYAWLLILMAGGISSAVISTITFPKLSQAFAQNDEKRFSDLFTNGVTITIMLGIPLTLASVLYSDQIIRIIYERGAFSGASTELTTQAFRYMAIGLVFNMVIGVVTGAFYSRKLTKTPVLIGFASIAVNIVFDLLLVGKYGNAGLAFATSLSFITGAIIFMAVIRKKMPHMISNSFVKNCVKIVAASVIAVGGTAPIYFGVMSLAAGRGWVMPRMVLLGVVTLTAIAVYALVLKLMKVHELKHFREIGGLFGRRRGG